jgi:uncharacterized protein DUF4055
MPVDTVHTAYDAAKSKWRRCRDTIEGSDAVKAGGVLYLPRLDGQPANNAKALLAYDAYRQRASFYNAAGRTIEGLSGTVFRKPPQLAKVPTLLAPDLLDITLDDTPFETFALQVFVDVLSVGRGGCLLDMAREGSTDSRPYWVHCAAEQIVNWRTSRIKGDRTLTRVVIFEQVDVDDVDDPFVLAPIQQYRECSLVASTAGGPLRYTVQLWRPDPQHKTKWIPFGPPVVPTRRGEPLTFIPFCFFGPNGIGPTIEPSPILDLIDVNLSHYRTSADYEHGCHFTALPTPYVCGLKVETALTIGSGVAWTFPNADTKVGMLEFTGDGLQTLERNLERKKDQMATLGGRMLETQGRKSETAETVRLRVGGEHSALRNAAIAVGLGLSKLLQMHAWWAGVDDTAAQAVTCSLNQQFMDTTLQPAEVTALMGAYQSGAISFETLYYNLQKGEIARPGIDVEVERHAIASDEATRQAIDAAAAALVPDPLPVAA